MRRCHLLLLLLILLAQIVLPTAPAAPSPDFGEPVRVQAAAVAETNDGYKGVLSAVTVTAARNGTGHVFVDTFPLAQVDMQGSARLATRIATRLAGVDPGTVDFYFTIRSSAPVIGGPSAGGILTVAALAALLELPVDEGVLMTGTINPDGTIGPVGGVPYKAQAAAKGGATLFLYPEGQGTFRMATTRYQHQGGEVVPVRDVRSVNLDTYCETELEITCRPVSDVLEAVEAVTGHRPARAQAVDAVDLRAIERLMEPRTRDLLNETHDLVQDGRSALANATGLSLTGRAAIRNLLDRAEGTLYAGDAAARDGRHYTAASRAFQAAILGREAHLLLDATTARDPVAFLRDATEDATTAAEDALANARRVPLEGSVALEARAAAERRGLEARATLDALDRALDGDAPDLRATVGELAYAIERTRTVEWWARIADDATGDPVSAARVKESAGQVLANARELTAYALALNGDAPGANEALALVADAERALSEGLAPGALLLALEADVRAQLTLEAASGGMAADDTRVQRARNAAAAELAAAEDEGRAALLAQAAFQFAEDLEDPQQAIHQYRLARATARFSLLLGSPSDPVPFEPVPATGRDAVAAGHAANGALPGAGALLYALGATLLVGVALGAVVAAPRSRA